MFYTVPKTYYYWQQISVDTDPVVCIRHSCATKRAKLRKHLNRLILFPATRPLESVAIDILALLPYISSDNRFLLVIKDCFMELTQIVELVQIIALFVVVVILKFCAFK